jgi:hypothetical protein
VFQTRQNPFSFPQVGLESVEIAAPRWTHHGLRFRLSGLNEASLPYGSVRATFSGENGLHGPFSLDNVRLFLDVKSLTVELSLLGKDLQTTAIIPNIPYLPSDSIPHDSTCQGLFFQKSGLF